MSDATIIPIESSTRYVDAWGTADSDHESLVVSQWAEEPDDDDEDAFAEACRAEVELAQVLGAEVIDVLVEQAERLVPGRCPQLQAVYGSVLFVDQDPSECFGTILLAPPTGPALLLEIPSWVAESEELYVAADQARGRMIAVMGPPVRQELRSDGSLVALVATPVADPGLLLAVVVCGEPWAVFSDVWPHDLHIPRRTA